MTPPETPAMKTLKHLARDNRGATMVEYILLVGVVALISISSFKFFSGKVWDRTAKQGETVGSINAGPGQ